MCLLLDVDDIDRVWSASGVHQICAEQVSEPYLKALNSQPVYTVFESGTVSLSCIGI